MTVRRDLVRRLGVVLICLGAGALLSGCHHRQPPVTQPAVLPALVQPPPAPASPSMASKPPESITEAEPVKVTRAKPTRAPKKSVVKTSGASTGGSSATAVATHPAAAAETPIAPALEAAAGPAAGSPIGALSAGGDAAPKAQEDAAELITVSEKRVDGLSQAGTAEQQAQVRQVRYFLKQAKQALDTGDAEGARTLATKAKLLMDDLEK